MFDRQNLLQPLSTIPWGTIGETLRGLGERARDGVDRGGAAVSKLGHRMEPALEWLARQRWLGSGIGSLAGKIIAVNLIGLLLLVLSILFFSPIQASLVQSKLESLLAEADILATSIASTATRERDRLAISTELMDPARHSELQQAVPERPVQFPIRPERIGGVLGPNFGSSGLRLRLFRTDGTFMYDSRELPGTAAATPTRDTTSFWTWFADRMDGTDLPVYRDIGRANFASYPEFAAAAAGKAQPLIFVNDRGRRTVTILTPVKRRDTIAVMVLNTRDGEIDKLVWTERRSVLWLGGIGLLVMAITSALLAGTIALPLRQLATAADEVQGNLKRRKDLPHFDYRHDEVSHLSGTLRDMTDALYRRIEASERFAADVAHELKNPLTSVRSAAETLSRVKSESDRKILTDTIENDVRRLTRLIDDISKATRADAEMAMGQASRVNMVHLLGTLAEMFNSVHVTDGQMIVLDVAPCVLPKDEAYVIDGHDMRLGQVFKNLIDNALSFSPAPGTVTVRLTRGEERMQIAVEDEGPGIPAGKFEKIFDRFYTDRPVGAFGNNSGLGLSICKEIVAGHHGTITAENRIETTVQRSGPSELGVVASRVLGARFVVDVPAAEALSQARHHHGRAAVWR